MTNKKFLLPIIFTTLLLLFAYIANTISPSVPPARYGAKMIFDPLNERLILFGGRADGVFGLKYFNDLWAFDYQTLEWDLIKALNQPSGRLSPGMVYDPGHHQIILFGGNSADDRMDDTWILSLENHTWEEVRSKNSPPPRSDMGMAYDDKNKVVVLFGGYCRDHIQNLCDDTWVFDPSTTKWTEMKPAISPPLMYGPTLVYDPANQHHLLWGGHMSDGSFSLGYSNTLWSYDYLNNTWQTVAVTPHKIPAARYWHHATFDFANSQLFLFGGDGGNGFLNDVWKFNVNENHWENVSTIDAPMPRINAAIAYDSGNDVIMIFGGRSDDRTILSDAWIFMGNRNLHDWINLSDEME